MKSAVVLVAILAAQCFEAQLAKAQVVPPFTVDCDATVPAAGDGVWIVGAIMVDYLGEIPILTGVACNSVPGSTFPIVPEDGIVCFCPSSVTDTNCHAHAEWTEPVTSTYCLQSPLDDSAAVEEAPSLVMRNGRIRRHRN